MKSIVLLITFYLGVRSWQHNYFYFYFLNTMKVEETMHCSALTWLIIVNINLNYIFILFLRMVFPLLHPCINL